MYSKRLRAMCQAVLVISSVIAISSCGDDNNNQLGPPATVTVSPTALHLELGRTTALTVEVKDAEGNINRTAAVTFQSSDTARATVANNGALCAGVWDSLTTPVVCTPGTEGPVNITASAGGVTSSPTVVRVHRHIARIEISTLGSGCESQTETRQFGFTAFDSGGQPVPPEVQLAPTWTSSDTNVATIDANGLATAKRSGVSTIAASIGTANSLTLPFTTCSPANIAIATQNSAPPETVFTLAPAGTKQLAATVTDENPTPKTIADPGLTYVSNDPSIASVSATGLVTAVGPGSTAVIAVCLPPTCNGGLAETVYSNVVSVTVTGTSSSRVYATGPSATTIVPIDTTTNVAGTAITVPTVTVSGTATLPIVNSMIFSKDGNRVFIGTDLVLLTLDVATNTFVNTNSPVRGKVLAVSNAGRVVIFDSTNSSVSIYDSANNSVVFTLSNIANATAAAWSPDGAKAYILNGNTVRVYSPFRSEETITLPEAASDVMFLTQGSAAYVGRATRIDVRATCNNSSITELASGPVKLVRSNFNSTQVFGVTDTSIIDVNVEANSAPCPPAPVHSFSTPNFGQGMFTPRQMIIPSNGLRVFVTTNLPNVLSYDPVAGTTSTINLISPATSATTGGATLDSTQLYVGTQGTNDIQRIDLGTGIAVQQITIGLVKSDGTSVAPEFVAVRPR